MPGWFRAIVPVAGAGLRDARRGRQAAGRRRHARASCRRCCARCRTTSTTEMDLALWDAGRAHPRRSDAPRAVSREHVAATSWPSVPRRHAAGGRSSDGLADVPAPLRASGRRRDRPRPAALVGGSRPHPRRARQLSAARRTRAWPPTRCSPRGAAEAEAMIDDPGRAGPAPRPAARPARPLRAGPGARARRRCASCRSIYLSPGGRGRAPSAGAGRRGARRARAASAARTTCSSSTSPRPAPGSPGETSARLDRASAARAYELELRRRHVPRVLLSDGTEPEAAAPRRRPGRRPRAAPRPRPGR